VKVFNSSVENRVEKNSQKKKSPTMERVRAVCTISGQFFERGNKKTREGKPAAKTISMADLIPFSTNEEEDQA
jgi:hypothetical protein